MDIHRVKRDRIHSQLQVLREWLASCQSGATAFMCSCGGKDDPPHGRCGIEAFLEPRAILE
jgi:hypothetical protein